MTSAAVNPVPTEKRGEDGANFTIPNETPNIEETQAGNGAKETGKKKNAISFGGTFEKTYVPSNYSMDSSFSR